MLAIDIAADKLATINRKQSPIKDAEIEYYMHNSSPVELMDYIGALEKALGKTAVKEFLPFQAEDVPDTYANVDDLVAQFHYKPTTQVEVGIAHFVSWYREYFQL